MIPKAELSCSFCVPGGMMGGRDCDRTPPAEQVTPGHCRSSLPFMRGHAARGLWSHRVSVNADFELGNLISSGHIGNTDIPPRTCHFLLRQPQSTSCAQGFGGFGPNAGEAQGADSVASPPASTWEHRPGTRQDRLLHGQGRPHQTRRAPPCWQRENRPPLPPASRAQHVGAPGPGGVRFQTLVEDTRRATVSVLVAGGPAVPFSAPSKR